MLGEWSEEELPVIYHDHSAEYGQTYRYYVVPCHPELMMDGRQVTGTASIKVNFTVKELFSVLQQIPGLDEMSPTQ